ncbi:MAG TPA: VCBS repeat-containing protein [Nannocystaceae bacterium]|nr:VCBS repeat-containing protein [Nannocystaceae bacterium]
MRLGWMIGMIAACGPQVATQDGDGSEGSSSDTTTSTTSTTATSSTATSVDESSSTGVAPSGPRRCFETIAIDVDASTYVDAARLRDEGPTQLLFVDYQADRTYVAAAAAIDDPWTTVQTIEAHEPAEVVDIDGDARDDVVMHSGGDAAWWRPDAAGVLAEAGPIVDESDGDTLLQIPDDPRAARAYAGLELEVMLGSGDGTFSPSTITPSPEMDYGPGPPVVAHGEGLLEVGRFRIDCIGFCADGSWLFRVESNGTASVLGTIWANEIVAITDLDHDGALDVFALQDGSLVVWRGPDHAEPTPLLLAVGAQVGDFDGDGFVDAMVNDGELVEVHWNESGLLGEDATAVALAAYPVADWGTPVDLDDDGAAEVVLGYGPAGDHAIVRSVACE